jgi:hypothetical protein
MGLGFETPYIISGWMLVALVILPFLFGLLYGMHIASKRFIIKLVKDMKSDKLAELIKHNSCNTNHDEFKEEEVIAH